MNISVDTITIREPEYSPEELTVIAGLYKDIVKTHSLCEGTGIIFKDDKFSDCDCVKSYNYTKALILSRIPKRHWNVKVTGYDEILSEVYDGIPVIITGDSGSGKTRFMSASAKAMILDRKRVYYTDGAELADLLEANDDNIYRGRLTGANVVCIDEIDYQFSPRQEKILTTFIKKLLNWNTGLMVVSESVESITINSIQEIFRHGYNIRCKVKGGSRFTKQSQIYLSKDFLNEANQFVNHGIIL